MTERYFESPDPSHESLLELGRQFEENGRSVADLMDYLLDTALGAEELAKLQSADDLELAEAKFSILNTTADTLSANDYQEEIDDLDKAFRANEKDLELARRLYLGAESLKSWYLGGKDIEADERSLHITTPRQYNFIRAANETIVNYTLYSLHGGVITAMHYNYSTQETRIKGYGALNVQLEAQRDAGLNGMPIDASAASELVNELNTFRQLLEPLAIRADQSEVRAILLDYAINKPYSPPATTYS